MRGRGALAPGNVTSALLGTVALAPLVHISAVLDSVTLCHRYITSKVATSSH